MFIEFAGRIVNPARVIAFDKNERHEWEGRFRIYCCFENTEIYEEFTNRAARDERFEMLKIKLIHRPSTTETKPYFMVEDDECEHVYEPDMNIKKSGSYGARCKKCKSAAPASY